MSTRGAFRIGDLVAEKGQKKRGFLQLGETVTGPIQLPLVIINGDRDGPVLCLTAGIHATEYPSIDALLRLTRELTPQTLRGTLIAVPVVNMHMFASRLGFVSPIDGLNLNKIAPANTPGAMSGKTTLRKTVAGGAPRLNAARQSAGSNPCSVAWTTTTTNGVASTVCASTKPMRLLVRPSGE